MPVPLKGTSTILLDPDDLDEFEMTEVGTGERGESLADCFFVAKLGSRYNDRYVILECSRRGIPDELAKSAGASRAGPLRPEFRQAKVDRFRIFEIESVQDS